MELAGPLLCVEIVPHIALRRSMVRPLLNASIVRRLCVEYLTSPEEQMQSGKERLIPLLVRSLLIPVDVLRLLPSHQTLPCPNQFVVALTYPIICIAYSLPSHLLSI